MSTTPDHPHLAQPSARAFSAPASLGDPRTGFARAVAVGTTTIAEVAPGQLGDPTPCDELDVDGLLGHLVGVLHRVAAIGQRVDPVAVPAFVERPEQGWLRAWTDAAADVERAWADDAALERTVVLPWATLTGGAALLGYVNEIVVHTWDLATATGQQPMWDDDVVAGAYWAITQTLPPTGRAAIFREVMARIDPAAVGTAAIEPPFADAVPVGEEATPIDRLVAYTGRTPRPGDR